MLINGKPTLGRVIFAHGAGAGMESEFIETCSQKLASCGLEVVRFNFPYMQKMSETGKRRPPDRIPLLIEHMQHIVDSHGKSDVPLFLAGKSMGGRVATMLLDQVDAEAAFVFGYPFHPRSNASKLRIEHLLNQQKPTYIFQGERDPMGKHGEVKGYGLPETVKIEWLIDGDHDLKPRKSSGYSQSQHIDHCIETIRELVNCQ